MSTKSSNEIAQDFFPFFKLYNNGRIERYEPIEKIPPCIDNLNRVNSRDVIISHEPNVSARIFMPQKLNPNRKYPLLIYIHGGGFTLGSAFDSRYHTHVTSLTSKANVMALSIDYRLAPENSIPACYDDSWTALKWVATHANGYGSDPWLNHYADLKRVVLAGDSAGANIIHDMLVRIGSNGLPGLNVVKAALVQPYFGGVETDRVWLYSCPNNSGLQDRRIRPGAEDFGVIGCDKVLVVLAKKDYYRKVGLWYFGELKRNKKMRNVELYESPGLGHVFHLINPQSLEALDLIAKLVSFINEEDAVIKSKI